MKNESSLKNISDKLKNGAVKLSATWFGVSSPFGDAFTSMDSTLGKVTVLVNTAIALGSLVAVGILVYGGYMYLTSNGDEDKIQQGTQTITNAVIGLVIINIAGLIIKFVLSRVLKV